MDARDEILNHIWSTLDRAAADQLLERVPVPELCTALAAILDADTGEAIDSACLVIRDGVLLASPPGRDAFDAALRERGVIRQLDALVCADDHHTRDGVVYTLGKICARQSVPVLLTAFETYRDTDPLLVARLISECIWLGADEWDLLDRALASPTYITRWSIIERLSGLDGTALDAARYDRRCLPYLEALQRDAQRLVREEATYWMTVLTTAIPRDAQRGERRRRRKALYAQAPPHTFMTCSIRFYNHLYEEQPDRTPSANSQHSSTASHRRHEMQRTIHPFHEPLSHAR